MAGGCVGLYLGVSEKGGVNADASHTFQIISTFLCVYMCVGGGSKSIRHDKIK